mgnify:CR=1 FL=1
MNPEPKAPQAPRQLTIVDRRTGKVVRSGTWSCDDPRCKIAPYEQRVFNLLAPVGVTIFGGQPNPRELIALLEKRVDALEKIIAKHGLK